MNTLLRLPLLGALCVGLVAACSSHDESPAAHARHVALDGQSNFRDLGGYETSGGRRVKWGEVYRSGALHQLSNQDIERLEDLGLRTDVSLLTRAEVESRGPDRLPSGARYVSIPMESVGLDSIIAELRHARATGDFSRVPVSTSAEIHRRLTLGGREQYAALFREIADPENRPLVFHCSRGVHRTGTAAALLLWSLGVPWETVRQDYLLSNDYRRRENESTLDHLCDLASDHLGVPPDEVDTTNMTAYYVLQGSYIDAARDEIIAEFGSVDGFFQYGLGLGEEEIASLRDGLLE